MSVAVEIIQGAEQAATLLQPARLRMLEELAEPTSAAGLARRLGLPRQQVNYHLRELEKQHLVELVEERRKGNCIERVVRASARSYVISPEVLGGLASDPASFQDRFSASYLIALAGRAIREIATLGGRAAQAKKRLATFSLDTEIRFSSAAARNAWADELANEVARLTAKYHDESSPHGRRFRVFVGAYSAITKTGSDHESTRPEEST